MFLEETVSRVQRNDPVQGRWDVSGEEAKVWIDSSSVALGVAVEVGRCVVEDASWLCKDESCHINMAELDAAIKGLNLVMAWKIQRVELLTDSVTVHRWISDGLSGKSRLRTKAASEILIRRRVGIVLSLVQEYNLRLLVTLIPSANNKADSLMRVPQHWLKVPVACLATEQTMCAAGIKATSDGIADIHNSVGHPGVRCTLYFAKRIYPAATRRQVRDVIANCDACQFIDPAHVKWQKGSLEVDSVW